MLLTITNTTHPATDLGYLLHKHPDKHQVFELPYGNSHIFYPEASEEKCTAVLMLEINPVALTRGNERNYSEGFNLEQYVNDRPYVASSFLTSAFSKVLGSAMNGTCTPKPELPTKKMELTVTLPVIRCRGGEEMVRKFFEPLGYQVQLASIPLDENYPEWGMGNYFALTLSHYTTISALLTQLYVLIPALDNNKHYFIAEDEINKLLSKGEGWLKEHPEYETITRRYLLYRRGYARQALDTLLGNEEGEKTDETKEMRVNLHQVRLEAVAEVLKATGAKSVADLGCGEGKLLRLLIKEPQFERIIGMDVSMRSLEVAIDRLYYHEMSPRMKERLTLIHGALTYVDKRLDGYDAAALVEVIEHLDAPRLEGLQRVVFGASKFRHVVVTTPNQEYNVLFETLPAGKMRHGDHRFEWTRAEFSDWCQSVSEQYNYRFETSPLGDVHETYGGPSQMAIFTKI